MAGSSYGDNADVSGSVVINDGSSSESDVRIESDNNTHMLFVDASTDRVGIGTDAPDYTLDVAGDIGVDQKIYHNGDANTFLNFLDDRVKINAGGINYIDCDDSTSAPHNLTINDGGNNVDFIIKGNGSNAGDPLFKTDASTGRVGINGVGTPSWELDVAGDIGLAEYIYHKDDDDTYIRFQDNDVRISTAGTERVTIDSNGSVGIGAEPNANYLLDVAGGPARVYLSSGDTNVNTRECMRFSHISTGTATTGFGTFIGFGLENSNGDEELAGGIASAWMSAADGSESSYLGFATNQMGTQTNQAALTAYGFTVHGAAYGSIAGNAGTSGLTVKTNRYADYAAHFVNDGNTWTRYGLRIDCGTDDNSGTNYAIRFFDGDGTSQGNITFSGGTVTYGAFTGIHDAAVQSSDFTSGSNSYDYGTIVKIISTSSPTLKSVSYVVAPTTTSEDKAVMGVYSGWAPPPEDLSSNNHQIFALGDGHILVCSEGGDIEVGDYICSSNTQGYGMKQDSDQLYNYTVAKATVPVTWASEGSNIKLISCTYHCA